MLTSRRTHMQEVLAPHPTSSELVPEAKLRGVQQLPHSCLGKLSQVPPAQGPWAACPEHRNPEP